MNFKRIGHILDLLILNLAFISSYFFRFGILIPVSERKQFFLILLLNVLWVSIVFISKPYERDRRGFNISKLIFKLFIALLIHLAVISIFWIFTKDFSFSRLRLVYFYSTFFILASFVRVFGVFFLRKLRQKGYFHRNYITIGQGKYSRSIETYYKNHPELGISLFKCFSDLDFINETLKDEINDNKIERVYIVLPHLDTKYLNQIILKAEEYGLELKVLMDYDSFLQKEISLDYHDYLPIFNISSTPPKDLGVAITKRTFDLVFSVLVLVFGFPVFVLLALITGLTSKGPIFYKSERLGFGGAKFNIYKFRSMYVNADEIAQTQLGGDLHSRGDQDPRITPWGRFIRKTRIDELPQFYNVLLGQMAVVGPRPLPKYDVDMILEKSEDKYHRILMMKPGLTSLGQLRVGYASTEEENIKRMNVDLLYHRKFSLTRELWLIAQTAKLMLNAKGK